MTVNPGQKIRLLRQKRGWTLADLKEKTGLSISFLSDIERGISNPSLKKISKIAEALGVRVAYLLGEEDHKTKGLVQVPVLYSIQNQKKLLAKENIKHYSQLDLSQKKQGVYFFLQMEDDSMTGSGIIPGSMLLIRQEKKLHSGDIGAIQTGEKILIRKVIISDQKIILQPTNHLYQTAIYPLSQVKIIGKVVKSSYDFE